MTTLPTRESFSNWREVQVRWSDMDVMGHVNNAVYFTYLEVARIDFLRARSLKSGMKHDGKGFGLVSIQCDFKKQIRYPADLEIGTRVIHIGNRSFHLEQGVFLKDEAALMAYGRSVMCWVDYEAERAIELPAELRAALEVTMSMG